MAGDINLREQVIILPPQTGPTPRSIPPQAEPQPQAKDRIMHQYGPRVQIVELSHRPEDMMSRSMPASQAIQIPDDLDEVGRFGLRAMQLRDSHHFARAKSARPYEGKSWHEGGTEVLCCTDEATTELEARSLANAPSMSARLTGSVAVGLIIVEGPTEELQFTEEERTKVVAEVQNGLGWLGSQNQKAAVVWKYDIQIIKVDVAAGADNLSFSQKENRWRDPVMKQMGHGTGMSAVRKYVDHLRKNLDTDWGYCAFFTKYPVGHFVYANIGGPRLVMHYQNDGWGPDNIDRVFTHETGHIFGAPDEYGASKCNTGGQWGFHKKPNANCENDNPNSVDCIMKGNTWNMCAHTPYHLGFPVSDTRYSGVWRAGKDKEGLWVDSNWSSFYKKWKEWGKDGLRLTDLKITMKDGGRRYHGVWREGNKGYALWVNSDWSTFRSKWKEWGDKGLRLIDLEIIPGSKNLYSGVWTSGKDAYGLWVNADWENFKAKWREWGKKGLRLIDLKVINKNGKLRYYGVWRAGSGKYALWVNAPWDSFNQKWREWANKGYRLIDLEVVIINGERRYFGVWGAGKDAYGLWVNANWSSFKAKWDDWSEKGYRLIDLDVHDPVDLKSPIRHPAALRSGFSTEEEDAIGMGFLSSEDPEFTIDTDMETGDVVLMPSADQEMGAAAAIAFGPDEAFAPANVMEEEGLGGMAEAPALAASPDDGFGGTVGDADLDEEVDGFGGIVF